jgi:preprotein translocase subunit SecD
MKAIIIKVSVSGLVLVLLASACSQTAQRVRSSTLEAGKPQFTIAPADLAAPAVLATNSSPSGANATIVIQLRFTAAKTEAFRRFTREHMKQQTQLVVGSKVVAEPTIAAEISDGRADIAFSSFEDARAVRDSLSKK